MRVSGLGSRVFRIPNPVSLIPSPELTIDRVRLPAHENARIWN